MYIVLIGRVEPANWRKVFHSSSNHVLLCSNNSDDAGTHCESGGIRLDTVAAVKLSFRRLTVEEGASACGM